MIVYVRVGSSTVTMKDMGSVTNLSAYLEGLLFGLVQSDNAPVAVKIELELKTDGST